MIKLIHGQFEDIPITDISGVDLIIADIPDCLDQKYPDYVDKMPKDEYKTKLYIWLTKMSELTKGPIFLLFNERWTKEIENTISNAKIKVIQRLLWHYNFGMDQSRHNRYSLCYRPIYWLHSDFIIPENIKIPSDRQLKYNDRRAASNGKIPPNVWQFPRICGNFKERRSWFPNQINQQIIERIIRGHCRENKTILDPFVGSGTSIFAAIKTNRHAIGIDISQTCIAQIKTELDTQLTKSINLIGQSFGRLIVIDKKDADSWGANRWLCQCKCGRKKIVTESNLIHGHTKSCGCLRVKHDHTTNGKQSAQYKSWYSMIQRCTNPSNKRYKDYGGNGINVCEEWLQFDIFIKDMPGWKPSLQIDRIDNSREYCKSNCRWANRQQQQRNKRNNRYETYRGKTQLVVEWAKEYNISYKIVWTRLYQLGWSIDKALTTPIKRKKPKHM